MAGREVSVLEVSVGLKCEWISRIACLLNPSPLKEWYPGSLLLCLRFSRKFNWVGWWLFARTINSSISVLSTFHSLFMECISVFYTVTPRQECCLLLQHSGRLLSMWIFLCVSDCSIFLLSVQIWSKADWQGCLLAFEKLGQAFENNKCRNSDTDFQCNGIFPLVSSKFNWTRRRKHTKKATRC